MRKFLIAAAAVAGLAFGGAELRAEEHEGVEGTIIDAKCGGGKKEEDVAKHGAGCVLKCASSGIGVLKGDKWIKFDEKGQKLAKAYLEKHKDDEGATKVHVEGKVSEDGKTIAVKEIHAQSEEDKKS